MPLRRYRKQMAKSETKKQKLKVFGTPIERRGDKEGRSGKQALHPRSPSPAGRKLGPICGLPSFQNKGAM